MILMVTANAYSLFVTIDVGDLGRNSDGTVFKSSHIGKLLKKQKIGIPEPTHLPNNIMEILSLITYAEMKRFLCHI